MTLSETPALIIKDTGKLVSYFGLPLYVPKGYKWVAMDLNGFIFGYTHKPEAKSKSFIMGSEKHAHAVQLGQVLHYEGDWLQSCVKVKQLPKLEAYVRT